MTTIGVDEARANLSKLVERVLAGEEVVITRRGKPVVRLVPAEKTRPPRRSDRLKSKYEVPASLFEPLPEDIIEAFYESRIFPDDDVR